MKVLKNVETIQLKLQGRINNKNVTRTVSFVECTDIDVIKHATETLSLFDDESIYIKPLSILVKVDKFSHTAYIRTQKSFDDIVDAIKKIN